MPKKKISRLNKQSMIEQELAAEVTAQEAPTVTDNQDEGDDLFSQATRQQNMEEGELGYRGQQSKSTIDQPELATGAHSKIGGALHSNDFSVDEEYATNAYQAQNTQKSFGGSSYATAMTFSGVNMEGAILSDDSDQAD